MAIVNGFITDGTVSINFAADATCVGGVPTGSISGTINDVFTGGPILEDFTFASATPVLVGENQILDMVHVVFEGVTVTNITTGETFTDGNAVLTTVDTSPWRGSITVFFDTSVLTFFGQFTGSATPIITDICQQPL